jgi:hypothetical protein
MAVAAIISLLDGGFVREANPPHVVFESPGSTDCRFLEDGSGENEATAKLLQASSPRNPVSYSHRPNKEPENLAQRCKG